MTAEQVRKIIDDAERRGVSVAYLRQGGRLHRPDQSKVRTPFGLCRLEGVDARGVLFSVPIKKLEQFLSDMEGKT